jgi:hypothetical protein
MYQYTRALEDYIFAAVRTTNVADCKKEKGWIQGALVTPRVESCDTSKISCYSYQ